MKNIHIIKSIAPGSIAEEMELAAGDAVVEINHKEIEDIFDYQYMIEEEYIELLVRRENGEEWLLEIEKDEDEDLGITFEQGLMDDYKSCTNKCIFCFIDQLPKGMRETMYFKDDDSRLSFLQGNYITLTNMKEKDMDRIIKYNLSPINISVHTTNPELRCQMLHNRFAGKIMAQLQKFYDNGVIMNGQIVLCKNINDGAELEKSIADLSRFLPYMESVSVVPMGMTKYRDGLAAVEPFNSEDAKKVIEVIERWQKKLYDEYGTHFIHAGDEWYIMAGLPLPKEETYDGYIQLENGVGMMRLLIEEFHDALSEAKADERIIKKDIVTGKLAYPFICGLMTEAKEKFKNLEVNVHCIRNDFFGESITVTGLVTGQDIIAQLKDKPLSNELLVPVNMLRSGEDVFLDDITLKDIEKALQVKTCIIQSSGQDLMDLILK